MTALSACQSASLRLTGNSLPTLFSTTDRFAQELADLASESAVAIAKAHEWRVLTKKHTIPGDGTSTAFALPSDYDRMPIKSNVYSTRSLIAFLPVRDLDQWLEFEVQPVVGSPGYWIILGGQFQVLPTMGASEIAKFYYLSNEIILNGTTGKTAFSADADTFKLSERLLTLGIIWRWRAQKRLEYAEDLQNYQTALNEEIGRDSGSRLIAVGRARVPFGAEMAYPGIITP
jgi:hypothetical protein